MIDNNCVYPSLHNNSYADSTISGYRYGDVFVEETTKSEGIACSGYANCYIGCSCNTSNGWYSSCQGTDCKSVTDTRYTGVNAMSASNVGDVTSLTGGVSTQSAGGNTQVVSLSGGVSTMSSSGATTCYKKKTCAEGGYSTSIPDGKTCDTVNYNGYTCYTNCKDNNYDFKVFTSGTSDSGTVTSMNTTVTLSGNGYNKSIKQSVNSASDTFSFTNLPSGTYTVEGTTTLQVKSGSGPAQLCAHNLGSTFEVTKQVTIGSGGVSSVSLSFTCNNSSGGIKPILPDPCTGSCSGDIPYPKTFNGNKCCCPTAGETNSRKCNCCIDTANPCPSNLYYVQSSDGSDCCCSDLNHTGGNWGSWEVPTSCYCLGPSVPQG